MSAAANKLLVSYGGLVWFAVIMTMIEWFVVFGVLTDSSIVHRAKQSYLALSISSLGLLFLIFLGPVGVYVYSLRLKLEERSLVVERLWFYRRRINYARIERAFLVPSRLGMTVVIQLRDSGSIVILPTAKNVQLLRQRLANQLGRDDLAVE